MEDRKSLWEEKRLKRLSSTYFRDMLALGSKYEEEVAQFFESQGFDVWRLGSWRLPIDLFVWDKDKSFCVEVKYRTSKKYPVDINETKLKEFLDKDCTTFMIVIHPNSSRIKIFRKMEFGEPWLSETCLLSTSFETIDYKEVKWHEVLSP